MSSLSGLIVEDDRDVAQLYERVMATSGLTVEIVHSGEAALARLAEITPDVVVVDLNLPPDISGIDVIRHIRADSRLSATLVVVATGHPDLADTVRAQADLVLLKPIEVNE